MTMDLGRVARFTNVTSEVFSHPYSGQVFTVNPGESLVFPYDLAKHLAKHLARKILISTAPKEKLIVDRPAWTDGDEGALVAQILSDESRQPVSEALSPQELLRKRVEELNANKPVGAPIGRTKIDVMNELDALVPKVEYDKRLSMAKLEELLAKSKTLTA